MQDAPQKLAFTKPEACEVMGIKITKLDELCAAGRLDARRIGKRVVITADSIRDYVANLPKANIKLPAAMRRAARKTA